MLGVWGIGVTYLFISVPERQAGQNVKEIYEHIIVKNCLKLMKDINPEIQRLCKPQSSKHTISPSNPTPGHIPRENHNLKIYMHPNVHCSAVYNNQDMEAT